MSAMAPTTTADGVTQRPPRAVELQGLARLLRLALRRDRILLPVWLGTYALLLVASVASVVGLYGTEAERLGYATVAAANTVARAFDGPMAGTSLGAIVLTETFGVLAVLVGIMSVQAVTRHTRLEEETGRAELVGAAVVGRHAPLTAGLLVALLANVLVVLSTLAVFLASDLPLTGSVLAASAFGGVGLVFAGLAAIAAQVSSTARGTNAIGGAAVGAAFLLRAVGDAFGTLDETGTVVTSAWPSWLSPIGWGQQARAFGGDRWWVLGVVAVAILGSVTTAFVLTRHRDVGAGMRPVRPGPATASRWLRSPSGLAWRLQRPVVVGWLVGMTVVALAFGAIGEEVDALLETSDELAALFAAMGQGDTLVDLYGAFMMGLLAVATGAFAVQSVLRVRSEELVGHAEPLLATGVARHRWLASHLGVAVAGSMLILTAAGLAAGTAYGLTTGEWGGRFGDWVLAALVQVPAVLALAGVVVLAVGVAPRAAAALGWTAVGVSLVMGQLGALFDLPQAILDISPFTHVPLVPAEEVRLLPLVVLTLVGLLGTAGGLVALRRRDLTTS